METHGKFKSYLVASSDIDLESAIRCAYDLGSADKIGDTISPLRQEINDMFKSEGSSLSWSPTAKYLFKIFRVYKFHFIRKFIIYEILMVFTITCIEGT